MTRCAMLLEKLCRVRIFRCRASGTYKQYGDRYKVEQSHRVQSPVRLRILWILLEGLYEFRFDWRTETAYPFLIRFFRVIVGSTLPGGMHTLAHAIPTIFR